MGGDRAMEEPAELLGVAEAPLMYLWRSLSLSVGFVFLAWVK